MILHATDSYFQTIFNYNNYKLHDRVQIYDKKIALKRAKYIKRMEMLMQAYAFVEKNLIRLLRLLPQIKGPGDSNEISERMAL